jgi:eukaryotic-like serine/threonine-protein kinase
MGEVYLALDTRLERSVAVKVLPPRAADSQSRERFEREARTVSRLSHPNICTLFDVGSQDGVDFLVMEYLEGETLARRLSAGALPLDQVLDYAIQIVDGLAKAHASGVLHRDLKPGNVIITSDGIAKILDFGLAKRFGADEGEATALLTMTEAGSMVGTVAYMAPEQTMGRTADVRSDLFSFGVMLYEMLAGARPFDGGNVISTIRRINDEEPRSLGTVRPDLPADVQEIVMMVLRKDADQRIQSAAEMRMRLRAAAGRSWSIEAPPRLPTRALDRRAPWIAAAVVAVIAVVAVVALGRSWTRTGSSPGGGSRDMTQEFRTAIEWVRHGQSLFKRYDRPGNVDQAIAAFTRAVALDPRSAAGDAGLAAAYLRKDSATPDPQWRRLATESARQALEANPDLAAARLVSGLVLLRAGKRDEARTELLKARDQDPLSADAVRGLGEYFYTVNDTANAELAFRDAIRIQPDDWRGYQALGQSLYQRARYTEAAKAWERADELASDNVLVMRNLAAVYHQLERTDEGVARLQRALEIEPAATTYSNLGTLRFFQGRYADASIAFEKAVALNPTYYLYWGNLGDAYRWIPGSTEKARDAYARASALTVERLKTRPDDAELRGSLAVYLVKSGAQDRAIAEVAALERMPSRTPGSYFKSMMVYELAGKRERALHDLETTLQRGYARREVDNEPELVKLRSDPDYHRMLARLARIENRSPK